MGAKTRKLSQINDSLIEWQSVVVADGSTGLTAEAGRGYFINTTAGAITVTFPASPKIGDTIILNDYASTFATNNVTINFNGNKLEADTENATLNTNDQTHTFVFTDATQGWKIVNQDTGSAIQPTFISATGGTVTTSGDFKIHTFTGDGTFTVCSVGNPVGGPNIADYMVVAGGGGGGAGNGGGGGGGGGFREGKSSPAPSYTASPLVAPTGITVTATSYPITVGSGGTYTSASKGGPGNTSIFSTITSAGGGGGGESDDSPQRNGLDGASGGGGGSFATGNPGLGGAGNTPPVSPPQGNAGGYGLGQCGVARNGGGGGGATVAGSPAPGIPTAGAGGNGATTSISGSPTSYAGGGGGGGDACGAGGTGGGGSRGGPSAGTANTGGGGAGTPSSPGGNTGGKGIVIIRYKFQ